MAATIKCNSDGEAGFKSGATYPVLSFGENGVVVRNEAGKIATLSHGVINEGSAWTLTLDSDAPAQSSQKPTGTGGAASNSTNTGGTSS